MLAEAGKKAASQKTVADPGKTPFYLPDALAIKGFFIDHVFLQDDKMA
jgi:hypothetical protein